MLRGLTVAVPENRQLEILTRLLEARGATVVKVPMVSIHDAPGPEPLLVWMLEFIARPPHEFILLTGEGLRRLVALAERHGLREQFIEALEKVTIICRGPKPDRALREIGLPGGNLAQEPTTEGVIRTLDAMKLEGHSIAVQLYGEDPNPRLMAYLQKRQLEIRQVAPYIYAGKSDENRVVRLIHDLAAGKIDVIAFTSQPQYKRLQEVARKQGLATELEKGLQKSLVAAVGPVVRDQLQAAGVQVAIMPERTYFMKPLVLAIIRYLEAQT